MKKFLCSLVCVLMLFSSCLFAKGPNEKELQKKAQELGLSGELEKANELLGEKGFPTTGKAVSSDDTTSFFLSLLWGSIGTGYFLYGKKVSGGAFMLCGIGLCVFPMFVSGTVASLIWGILLTAIPFKVDI